MDDKIMYPSNIKSLLEKIEYLKKTFKNDKEKIRYLDLWLKWFYDFKIDEKLFFSIDENMFLKPYFEIPDKYGIQVWVRGKEYNKIVYNLISNYVDEFSILDKSIFIPKE